MKEEERKKKGKKIHRHAFVFNSFSRVYFTNDRVRLDRVSNETETKWRFARISRIKVVQNKTRNRPENQDLHYEKLF